MFLLVPFRIQAPDRHGSESEKEGMWPKIGEIGAVGGLLLPCLPFGPGPGLGLVAALPPIWADLTTDAGDKRGLAHPASQEKFKGGAGGEPRGIALRREGCGFMLRVLRLKRNAKGF